MEITRYPKAMNILEVIRRKGSEVLGIAPEATIGELVNTLSEGNVGALVVMDGDQMVGIISERDVMHGLAKRGAALLQEPVSSIMTQEVQTCEMGDKLEKLATTMTELRIRHLPVVEDGELKGIVSIGDVVRQRLEDLQAERDNLIDYMHS